MVTTGDPESDGLGRAPLLEARVAVSSPSDGDRPHLHLDLDTSARARRAGEHVECVSRGSLCKARLSRCVRAAAASRAGRPPGSEPPPPRQNVSQQASKLARSLQLTSPPDVCSFWKVATGGESSREPIEIDRRKATAAKVPAADKPSGVRRPPCASRARGRRFYVKKC